MSDSHAARVSVTAVIEYLSEGSWSGKCTVDEIYTGTAREARRKLDELIKNEPRIRIVSVNPNNAVIIPS